VVYLCGWIAPLFENDSAQFAVMAMRMVRESDFISLIKGGDPYLDKPHLHYWLAAISMKFFGINDLAYRFSALLAAALAGISVWGLSNTLNGRVAARTGAEVVQILNGARVGDGARRTHQLHCPRQGDRFVHQLR
jgi:4-amino-4-deoxy-L-arabinose transferase-like glycosyltransferase